MCITAYQAVTSDEVHDKFEKAWGATSNTKVGLTVTEMMPGILEGKTHALYILGEDPSCLTRIRSTSVTASKQIDFLVLQEIFPSETAAYADVLLPGVTFAEKTGTFTNTERRVQMVRKAIPTLGDARDDWWITAEIAKRILAGTPDRVRSEAPYSGWDYRRHIRDHVRDQRVDSILWRHHARAPRSR